MRVPIACRLTADAARTQVDEWRGLLGTCVVAVDRASPTQLRLRLGGPGGLPGPDRLDTVVRLAQREKECCPFFDFALEIEADTISLRVTVPEDAAPILDDFGRMAAEVDRA